MNKNLSIGPCLSNSLVYNDVVVKNIKLQKYKLISVLKDEIDVNVSLYIHIKKNVLYVIKSISENEIKTKSQILNEAQIGKKLSHENFVKTYKSYYDGLKTHHLIIEYINGNLLEEHVKNKNSLDDTKTILTQLFKAVIYALEQNVCPNDLHAKNIIVQDNKKISIFDYGEYLENDKTTYINFNFLYSELKHLAQIQINRTKISYDCGVSNWLKLLKKTITIWDKYSLIKRCEDLLEDTFLQKRVIMQFRPDIVLSDAESIYSFDL